MTGTGTPGFRTGHLPDVVACLLEKGAKMRNDFTEPGSDPSDLETFERIPMALAEYPARAEAALDSQQARGGEDAPRTRTGKGFDLF